MVCRYEGTGVHQLGLVVEGATGFDSGNWSFLVYNQGQVVSAEFEVKHCTGTGRSDFYCRLL